MATFLEKRTKPANLSESTRKVRDPLQRLRVFIRTYVITEALTTLLICLAVFFWVGLALDYGSFKLFGSDWVKDMPRWMRAVLLATGLIFVGLVVEIGKSLRLRPEHDPGKDAPVGSWLAHHPGALMALFGLLVVLFYTGWVIVALLRDSSSLDGWVVGLIFGGLLVAFTSAIVIKRLLYEFRDESLAMVLEKRFPKLLGDRLITAVELHDPKAAAKYGYSAAMIEQTIHEAAWAVDRLDLREVFDWKRLRNRVVVAVLLTAGMYLTVFGGLTAHAALNDREAGSKQFTQFNDTAAIWAERNILLDNERWPTRSLVVLIDFPASGEMKIGRGVDGKDVVRADLKARAIEFAFHDRGVPQSWRAATLDDVTGLGIAGFNTEKLPRSWQPVDPERGWSIDELKLRLKRLDYGDRSVEAIGKELQEEIQNTISEVTYKAAESSMSRTLRQLVVPGDVMIRFVTEDGQSKSEVTMTPRENNEYTGTLDGLTQTIFFHLAAEDFRSDNYRITLVPPPRVAQMRSIEAHPAYLYHLTEREQDDQRLLHGLKQKRKPYGIDVLGSVKPKVEPPFGSDVTLEAVLDKPLRDLNSVRLETKGSLVLKDIKPEVIDQHNFRLTIPNVRSTLDFRFEFIDTDGAPGVQEVLIEPKADEAPEIRQFKPEVVRQVGNKFLITPSAVIPFSYDILDDAGISSIEFVYLISESPPPNETARRAARVAAGVGLVIGTPQAPLTSYTYLRALPVTLHDRRERITGQMPLPHFQELFNSQRRQSWEDTLKVLEEPRNLARRMKRDYVLKDLKQLDAYLTDHDRSIEDSRPLKGMDVSLIQRNDGGVLVPLKAREFEIQRQYDMEVKLEVRDTNIDKPGRGVKTAPAGVPLQFTIVSEAELLYEIGQEEQRFYDELYKTHAELKKGHGQLQNIRFGLPPAVVEGKPINFESFSVQVEEVEKLVNEGSRVLTKVYVDYDRILRELRTNRISNRDYVGKVQKRIVEPLRQIQTGDFRVVDAAGNPGRAGYPRVKVSGDYFRKSLDSKDLSEAKKLEYAQKDAVAMEQDLGNLISALGDVLAEMVGVVGRQEALKRLVRIEQDVREELRRIQEYEKLKEDEFFK